MRYRDLFPVIGPIVGAIGDAIKSYRATKLSSKHPGDPALVGLLGGQGFVDPETAQTISAYWNGMDQISNALALLPLLTYERIEAPNLPGRSSKKRATDFRLFKTLVLKPNGYQSSFQWRKMMQGHVLLRGNAYSFINVDAAGNTTLLPLNPDRVTPFLVMQKKRVGSKIIQLPFSKGYEYQTPEGSKVVFIESEILHIMGMSNNGYVGIDPLTAARRSLQSSIGGEEFSARFFENDATPTFALKYPGKLDDDAYNNLRNSWRERHQGVANAHTPAILEEGLEPVTIGLSLENSQFIEGRKFQITEVARWLNIQPHKIKDLERATNNNIEQQSLEYLTDTILPYLISWQQSLTLALLSDNEQKKFFIEFLTNALMQTDIKARSQFYKDLRQIGALSANDIRDLENMVPIGLEGEVYVTAVNMQNSKALIQTPEEGEENE